MFTWDKYLPSSANTKNLVKTKNINVQPLPISKLTNSTQFTNFRSASLLFPYLIFLKNFINSSSLIVQKSFGFSFFYIQGFIFVLFIDACLTDDEPL